MRTLSDCQAIISYLEDKIKGMRAAIDELNGDVYHLTGDNEMLTALIMNDDSYDLAEFRRELSEGDLGDIIP